MSCFGQLKTHISFGRNPENSKLKEMRQNEYFSHFQNGFNTLRELRLLQTNVFLLIYLNCTFSHDKGQPLAVLILAGNQGFSSNLHPAPCIIHASSLLIPWQSNSYRRRAQCCCSNLPVSTSVSVFIVFIVFLVFRFPCKECALFISCQSKLLS